MSPKDGNKKEVDPFAALTAKAQATGDIAPPDTIRAEDALDAILHGKPPVEDDAAVDLSTASAIRPEVSSNALESLAVHKNDAADDEEEEEDDAPARAAAPAAAKPSAPAAPRPTSAGSAEFAARQAQARKFQQANALAQHLQLKKFAIPLLLVVGALLLLMGTILVFMLPPSAPEGAATNPDTSLATSPWTKVMVFSAFPMGLILMLGAWLFHQDVRRQEKRIADAEAK